MIKDERSERALELTESIIFMNPAHYTIWQYRMNILDSLKSDLHGELEFLERLAQDHPKSYQIWHYRQVIIEKLGDPMSEFEFIRNALDDDSKNYHTWSYRQWLVRHFNLWDGEISYVEELIDRDIRNNSAWNHRFFVSFHDKKPDEISPDITQREITFAKDKIALAPNNPSPWNYLRGVIDKTNTPFSVHEEFCRKYTGLDQSDQTDDLQGAGVVSAQALGFLVEIYDDKKQRGKLTKADLDQLDDIFDLLSTRHDRIRSKYWKYRKSTLVSQA